MNRKRKIVEKETEIQFKSNCMKIHDLSTIGCRVCLKKKSEWKEIQENPWFSRGEYSTGHYSTWNPIFNDRRIFSCFCYECWVNYRDIIMIVDGGLHLVTNWSKEDNLKVQRTSGEIQENNSFFTSLWNFKNGAKSKQDEKNELEKIIYCFWSSQLKEIMIVVKLEDGGTHKAVSVSQLIKLNPHLPGFQFRFPNHVEFYKILQWTNKNKNDEQLKMFGFISEWYNPDL